MSLKFRSHEVQLPSNADGYYFTYGASRDFSSIVTRGYYVAGTLVGGVVTCKWFVIPELIVERESSRDPSTLTLPAFIKNPD
jgi:hypothetical protein